MAAKNPVTGSYLATINGVTTRTTREDIKNLGSILKEHGATITSIISKGYLLEIKDNHKFRKFLQTLSQNNSADGKIPDTPEERVTYIIRKILLNDYIKLDDLADELYISRSTIQQDMKHVRNILQKYGISLEPRPNYGLKAVGDEIKKRFCLSEYLFERNEKKKSPFFTPLSSSLSVEEVNKIKSIILKKIDTYQTTLSDIAINNLLIHIAIACERIISGHYVAMYHSDVQEIKKQKEFDVAKEIVKDVEQLYHIRFPQEEVVYIAMHLLGTKLLSQTKDEFDHVIDEEIFQLVTFILEKIEEQLELDIKDDEELIYGLSLHLKPAVNRIKFGMNIRNPMLEDIKNNYPLAYEAGIIAGIAIKELTGIEIDENETGYIALHIGAAIERKKLDAGPKQCLIVCASGMGTARLIYYRLKSYFGNNLKIAGTTEYYKLKQYDLTNIDFIVSSIPVTMPFDIPVIEVNAVIGEKDLQKIEKFLVKQQIKPAVSSFFLEDFMFLQQTFSGRDDVLQFLSKNLMDKGIVGPDFLKAVHEREEVASTAFGNLVAIPHPISPQSSRTLVSTCTLTKPVLWADTPVQIVFLLCVKKNSREDLQEMYDLLGNIIEDKEMVQKILKAKTYRDFIRIIQE